MTTVHGGLDAAELRRLGLRPEQVLDFSSNVNPLGMSLRVRHAAVEANLSAYPDRHCLTLREAMAARLEVGINKILVGNGTVQLIHLLTRAFLNPGQTCLIFAPTFGEYEEATTIAGGGVHFFQAEEAQQFRWSIDAAVYTIKRIRPGMVFLCNPNNPTGVYLDRSEVQKILAAVAVDSLLVLDDSYAPLSDCSSDSLSLLNSGNIAILRSMTKDHALAGVRLGYILAEPSIVPTTARLQPAWSVNAVAQTAGVAALAGDAHVAAARKVITQSKAYLYHELEALGVPVTASAANFVLARVGDAAKVRGALLWDHIAVRDCTSFGLPEYIRIAVRNPEECVRLIEALREALDNE